MILSKRYVGIDPSSTTGFIIQDYDRNIIYENDIFYEFKKDPERMIYIADEVISKLDINTDIIGIEHFSYNSKGRGVDFQFGLGWVIREQLHRNGFTWTEISPTQLKKFATSNDKADKKVIQAHVKKRWDFYHGSDNITDAFVLSEIAKVLDVGDQYYFDLKEHEKEVLNAIRRGALNNPTWDTTKVPSWMNPRSKYYFVREK